MTPINIGKHILVDDINLNHRTFHCIFLIPNGVAPQGEIEKSIRSYTCNTAFNYLAAEGFLGEMDGSKWRSETTLQFV